jgi:hypothetical protein
MSDKRLVTVCDSCLRASCWHYIFPCDHYREAGLIDKTVDELRALNREHESYYLPHAFEPTLGLPGARSDGEAGRRTTG